MLRPRVKLCGMTRTEDIACAIDLGADAIGLIFYEKSLRYVTVGQARQLLKNIPPFITVTAVVVNPARTLVEHIIAELPVDLIQFHGDEPPEFCQQFNRPFVKAIAAESTSYIQQMSADFAQARAILLDTPSALSKGGTGMTFDWQMIPQQINKPFILAGGLNAANIRQAVKTCATHAVDVCSGVEASPGIKDHQKMNEFMKTLWHNHEV